MGLCSSKAAVVVTPFDEVSLSPSPTTIPANIVRTPLQQQHLNSYISQQPPNPHEEPYDIFLSHAGCDKMAVGALHESLSEHGLRAFYDVHSLIDDTPGMPFDTRIFNLVLKTRPVCLFYISESFFRRKWTMIEAMAFLLRAELDGALRFTDPACF